MLEACLAEDSDRVKQLAMDGNPVAQFQLTRDKNYVSIVDEDLDLNARFLRESSKLPFAPFIYQMATQIYYGERGFSLNEKRAFALFLKCAGQHYVDCQHFVALLYAHGTGTRQSWERAEHWIRRGADQGYAPSQYELGTMYLRGLGVDEDREVAMYWREKAARQGYAPARTYLETIKGSSEANQSVEAATDVARKGAHRAVWKLIDTKRTDLASAFAVGPRLVLTVAHYLFSVAEAGSDRFALFQTGRKGGVEVLGARAISATHDLALLETATPMVHYLSIAKALPHGLADQFRIAGYPRGRFETLRVITPVIHGDVDYFNLPVDRVVRGGISGAPVLAPNGEVIALQRTANDNVAGGVRFEVLNQFVNGSIGVGCGSSVLAACLKEASQLTKAVRRISAPLRSREQPILPLSGGSRPGSLPATYRWPGPDVAIQIGCPMGHREGG